MSGNGSVGGEKPRGLRYKTSEVVPTVCRLSLTGKEERDLG